jgi:hypothetical protein
MHTAHAADRMTVHTRGRIAARCKLSLRRSLGDRSRTQHITMLRRIRSGQAADNGRVQ